MEPIAIVTGVLGALVIVARGGLVVAPTGTMGLFRRVISTHRRIRIAGCVMTPIAASLILTAQQARPEHGNVAVALEVLGWVFAACVVWVFAAPGSYHRVAVAFINAVTNTILLRTLGLFGVAFGCLLVWLAFFVF